MRRSRLAMLGVAIGVAASQAGHLVAYQIRYGAAAQQLQSTGAHAYFPTIIKTGLGLAALFVLGALLLIGAARMVAGRRVAGIAPPSLLRVVALLFCVQLGCFVVQETVESAAAGASATSPAVLVLWGTLGQLPVAVVAAIALRWLAARLGPAVARLRLSPTSTIRLVPDTVLLVSWAVAPDSARPAQIFAGAFNRRGPPI